MPVLMRCVAVELRGSVVITASTTAQQGQWTPPFSRCGMWLAERAVNLTDSSGENAVVISYRDQEQIRTDLSWYVTWYGTSDGDILLEDGEIAGDQGHRFNRRP